MAQLIYIIPKRTHLHWAPAGTSNSKFGCIEATRCQLGASTRGRRTIFGPQSPLDLAF